MINSVRKRYALISIPPNILRKSYELQRELYTFDLKVPLGVIATKPRI